MEVNKMPEQDAPEITRSLIPNLTEKQRSLLIAGSLGGVAALTTASELMGVTPNLPDSAEWIATSGKHPAVGYLGALAATSVLKNPLRNIRTKVAIAGATVANFSAEVGQVFSPWAVSEYANFWTTRNLPETGKDYAFALAGLGLFLFQNRRQNN
jgi:hypothetical protein